MDKRAIEITKKAAKEVLLENLYEVYLNDTLYRRTVPSKKFYVHQWNWDSATHAMGLVHVDEKRAFDELRSLFAGQWGNGLIPHMIFNPNEKKYFPGPSVWGTKMFANGEIVTSGMTQPPLITKSVLYMYQISKDREAAETFLNEALPALVKYHEYLKTYRDPENCGLLTIIHPWESGTDNSPRFDALLKNIRLKDVPESVKQLARRRTDVKLGKKSHRPLMRDYYRYLYLVDVFKNLKWDPTLIVSKSPFAMKDVLFNAIWYMANQSLSELLTLKNKTNDAKRFAQWAEQTKQAVEKSWSDVFDQFADYNVTQGKFDPMYENTIATLMPFLIPGLKKHLLKKLIRKLTNPNQYWAPFPAPTTPLNSQQFDPMRYWRGPTWPITNLLLIEGLDQYKSEKNIASLQNQLIEKTLSTISNVGFYEYYSPLILQEKRKSTASLGFGSFSWTAAIFLYLLHKQKQEETH